MAVDITQFHKVFFEESFEGLQIMESGLLELEPGTADAELINTIFRAAHSIKGGSGTFGFTDVARFTHHLETLLDEMRSGRRAVTSPAIDTLLQAVDCLGALLRASQAGTAMDQDRVTFNQAALEALLAQPAQTPPTPLPSSADSDDSTDDTGACGWQIVFAPHRDIFATGNDPIRIIRELSGLGTLTSEIDLRFLPGLDDYNPEECFLSWNLTLLGDVTRADIEDVFAWVEDNCDMVLRPLSEQTRAAVDSLPHLPVAAATPVLPPVQDSPPPPPVTPAKPRHDTEQRTSSGGPASIRVDTLKIDQLINLVGELVITQSMLSMLGENFVPDKLEQLQSGLAQLERHTRDLQ